MTNNPTWIDQDGKEIVLHTAYACPGYRQMFKVMKPTYQPIHVPGLDKAASLSDAIAIVQAFAEREGWARVPDQQPELLEVEGK